MSDIPKFSRRDFLGTSVLSLTASAMLLGAKPKRPKVAAIFTSFTHRSYFNKNIFNQGLLLGNFCPLTLKARSNNTCESYSTQEMWRDPCLTPSSPCCRVCSTSQGNNPNNTKHAK